METVNRKNEKIVELPLREKERTSFLVITVSGPSTVDRDIWIEVEPTSDEVMLSGDIESQFQSINGIIGEFRWPEGQLFGHQSVTVLRWKFHQWFKQF